MKAKIIGGGENNEEIIQDTHGAWFSYRDLRYSEMVALRFIKKD